MAANKQKTQNIITAAIVGVALILAVVVVLVQTGVISKNDETTEEETIIESRIVTEVVTNEEGEEEILTILETYAVPVNTAKHRYSTNTTRLTTTKEEETEEQTSIVEHSKIQSVTDADGQVLYDDNGEIQTEVIKYTEIVTTAPSTKETTTETTTEYVPEYSYSVVTDKISKKPKKDKDGNTVTEAIILNPTTTEATTTDRWTTEETTTKKSIITTNYTSQESLENAILSQFNDDRAIKGLEPLTSNKSLKTAARTNSLAMFQPNINKETGYSKLYSYSSTYGGTSLYNVIATAGAGTTAMTSDVTQVGIGIYKSGDKYYTTIIFQ